MALFKSKQNFFLILILIMSLVVRIFKVGEIPPSLYTDEINQGYNAYSILQTGHDEHGQFLPLSLRSFGDYKPPLPTYLMIPFIKIFGLTELAVRLPQVILGVISVVLMFYSVKLFWPAQRRLALLAAFIAAVSPWHILESRSAMLVMVSLVTLQLAVYFFLKSIRNIKFSLIWSAVFFALSVYAYYGMRLIVPLFLLYFLLTFRKVLFSGQKGLFTASVIFLLMTLPILLAYFKDPDVLIGRARTVSVFYDQGIKLRQWELLSQDVSEVPGVTLFFHNRYYMYGRDIARRFLSHFDFRFLALTGDKSPPFEIPSMGIIYPFEYFLIAYGIFILFRKKTEFRNLLVFWLIISVVPAALTFMTPSANRTFNVVFPFIIFTGIALAKAVKARNKGIIGLLVILYMVGFAQFLKQYFLVLPKEHADWWNFGLKDAAVKVAGIENNYSHIIVPDLRGMPYIYFLFYNQYDPALYQKEAQRSYAADRFGYEHVEGFGKYLFPNDFTWDKYKADLWPDTLFVVPYELENPQLPQKDTVYYPDKKGAYYFYESP